MKKWILISLLLLASVFVRAEEESVQYWENVIPGAPIAPGKRLGGVWKKSEPKCNHDLTTMQMLKVEAQKNAKNWRKISFVASCVAGIAVLIWYVFHIPQAGGVAIVSVAWSIFSTFMAMVVSISGVIVLLLLGVGIIGLGVFLHKKDFFKWLKERKNGVLRPKMAQVKKRRR